MANFEIPENPEFSTVMRRLETTDPAAAELFNAMFERLLNNDVAIIAGTIPVGDAEKLGSKTSEEWQTKLDNIQTTSQGNLSQVGWYRVAETTGGHNGSLFLRIGNLYNTGGCEEHTLFFNNSHNNIEFIPFSCKSTLARVFTKVRYTRDNGKRYLEVYYALDVNNPCVFSVFGQDSTGSGIFKAIAPTLTSETVDGVVVTCEYDIPTNASPVNSLDLYNTVRANLSKIGWYRVAIYDKSPYGINGTHASSCTLIIRKTANNNNSQYTKVNVRLAGNSLIDFKCIDNKNTSNTQFIDKIRYTKDTENQTAYIEIYYNTTSSNDVAFTIVDGFDGIKEWKTIDPVLTEDTVDGVAVVTTYDIDKDVNIVTTVDMIDYAEMGVSFSPNDASGTTLNELLQSFYDRAKNTSVSYARVNVTDGSGELYGGTWLIENYKITSLYGCQRAIKYGGSSGDSPIVRERSLYNGQWSSFMTVGKEIKSPEQVVVKVDSTNSVPNTYIEFRHYGEAYGCLGFDKVDNPVVYSGTLGVKKLFHEGNKPSGSYIGNGSATQRTITIGGIGSALLIKSEKGTALIPRSATGFGIVTTGKVFKGFDGSHCWFDNDIRVLKIQTDDELLNANGITYTYYSL